MRRAIKGMPDFSFMRDKEISQYCAMIERLAGSYRYCNKDISETLKRVWKDLESERQTVACVGSNIPISIKESDSAPKMLKVSRLKKSPVVKK